MMPAVNVDGEYRYYESDDSSEDESDFDNILRDLEKNDPGNTYMELCWGTYSGYRCIDWAFRGRDAFANNSCITTLYVEGEKIDQGNEDAWQNGIAFYRALAGNRSIADLAMNGYIVDMESVLEILMPFFEHNRSLRSFDAANCILCQRSSQLLVSALSKCNTLCTFKIHCSDGGSDCSIATKLIEEVAMHPNLKTLQLDFSVKDNQWCASLASLLQSQVSRIEDLILEYAEINDEGVTFIGNALANNTSLKKISLGENRDITAAGWVAFANSLTNSVCSLREIDLSHNEVTDEALAALANYFTGRNTTRELSLRDNTLITPAGWRAFFNQLRNSNAKFEMLDLYGNGVNDVGDSGVIFLVNCLADMNSLKSLDFTSHINQPGANGARAIANSLRSPHSSLEVLAFEFNENYFLDDEMVELFADALLNNKHLKSLEISTYPHETSRGLNAVARLLCNTESIESTYRSNHTLQKQYLVKRRSDLTTYLKLNENENKFEVARQKILQYYFMDGNNNMQDILELEQNVFPFVINWAGRDVTGFSLLYCILRAEPSLFKSKVKAGTLGCKRMRVG